MIQLVKIVRPIFLVGIGMIFVCCASNHAAVEKQDTQPNLLIIQTDEHNFRTLGCYRRQLNTDQAEVWGKGNVVATPNIDFLAENGILFTKFYAAAPVCTPSRSSFISGLYPQNTGAPANNLPLRDSVITYSHVLSANGYKTAFVGKWHLDGTGKPQWAPERKFGFEDNKYMFNRGHWKKMEDSPQGPRVAARNQAGKPTYNLDGADERSFTTDFLVDKGIEFIQRNKEYPFSLYISLPDPHGPDRVRPPYDTMYQHMEFIPPATYHKQSEDIPTWAKPAPRASVDQSQYFGMVKCIDDNVGKIINYLRQNDLLERTIIIFTSDHGDLRGEHHKDNKGNPLEASAKVPFIVYYPLKIPSGAVVKNAVNTADFSPTILSFIGLRVPSSMRGRDFSEFLQKPDKGWEDITFMRNAGAAGNGQWMAAVTSQYKLIISNTDKPWLIDMESDPDELINFINETGNEQVTVSLAKKLRQYGYEHNDPFLKESKMATDLELLISGKK